VRTPIPQCFNTLIFEPHFFTFLFETPAPIEKARLSCAQLSKNASSPLIFLNIVFLHFFSNNQHQSEGLEPCAHSYPATLRWLPEALTPWSANSRCVLVSAREKERYRDRDTETQRHRDTETQRQTQRHRDTKGQRGGADFLVCSF